MKNLFNKATQSISEVIVGPKIKDTELENKIEEMRTLEKNIQNLRNLFPKIATSAQSQGKIFKEFSEAIKVVYGKENVCSNIGIEIADFHLKFEEKCEEFSKNLNEEFKRTNDWSNMFENAKNSMKEREEIRKKLERYIDKTAKLNKLKMEKEKKNVLEQLDKDKLSRVRLELKKTQNKMNKTSEEYLNFSFQTYQKINYIIDSHFLEINSTLSRIVCSEIKFFNSLYSMSKVYESLDSLFENSLNSFYRPISKYDPAIYIKEVGVNPLVDKKIENDKKEENIPSRNLEKPSTAEEKNKGFFSSIGGFFRKKEIPTPTDISSQDAVQPVCNVEQVQYNQNVNKHSNSNLPGNNIEKNPQQPNIKTVPQPLMPTSFINNLLNVGPGADRSKDIKITHNNEVINVSQSLNTLNAGMSFYNEHKESINQMTRIANSLKPSNETTSTFKSVLETAGTLMGSLNNKK